LHQAALSSIKRWAVGIFPRDTDQLTTVIERPRMVWTLKRPRVARLLATDKRATVWTSIEQHSHLAIIPSRDNDWATCNPAGAEVSRVWHFRFMPSVDPAPVKNTLSFKRENRRVSERTAIDAKQSGLTVVDNHVVEGKVFHRYSWEKKRETSGKVVSYQSAVVSKKLKTLQPRKERLLDSVPAR
jgi:hypothetical protein